MSAKPVFADLLKEARLAAGLSQARLARTAGLTGSYISLLESRRRPPPTTRVIRSLARALGVAAPPLLEAAALERSPEPVRRHMERIRREGGRAGRARDRLLTTTLFHLARRPRVIDPMAGFLDLPPGQMATLGRLVGRFREVPSLKEAEARSNDLLEEVSPKDRDAFAEALPSVIGDDGTRGGDGASEDTPVPQVAAPATRVVPIRAGLLHPEDVVDHYHLDARLAEPDAFLWAMPSDDLHPRVESGDLLVLVPGRAPQGGDLVAFRHEGRDRAAFHERRGGEVRLSGPRPERPPLRLDAKAWKPLAVATAILRTLGPP